MYTETRYESPYQVPWDAIIDSFTECLSNRNLSVRQAAKEIGVDPSVLSRFIHHKFRLSVDNLVAVLGWITNQREGYYGFDFLGLESPGGGLFLHLHNLQIIKEILDHASDFDPDKDRSE